MKTTLKYLLATPFLLGAVLSSCVSEEPFGDGQGTLRMKMVVNSTLTRNSEAADEQSLADKCIVYISNAKGLLYKYKGVDNLPTSLALKTGTYVAEAWTGDSVSASFDKKFYKAYQPFEIATGNATDIVLNCRIANVVASVAPSEEFKSVVKDYKVTVGHSYATLDFLPEMEDAHGYFMMPWLAEQNAYEANLEYTITGTLEDGTTFERKGTVWNVQRAHEYVLNINYTPAQLDPYGGAIITVVIDDHELVINDTVEISGAPVISGVGYDISAPMLTEPGAFERRSIFVQSLTELRQLSLHTDSYTALGLPGADVDFVNSDETLRSAFAEAGVWCTSGMDGDIHTARVIMDAPMLNRLPIGTYNLTLTALDANSKKRERTLTIEVSQAGVVIIETPWADVYAHQATLYGTVVADGITNPRFRIREAGTSDWTEVACSAPATSHRKAKGDKYTAVASGLKSGTRYEYQTLSDQIVNEKSAYFTTETEFLFPNNSFEQWANGSDGALVPSSDGAVTFWDSGNHGSITMNKNVTTQDGTLFHTGSSSAKLQSQFVGLGIIGKFAAGNLFVGKYEETLGTNGRLTFGRPFNGSRPVKLRGWVYYKGGTVDYSENDDKHPDVVKGSQDRGIVYVALTTQSVEVNTKTKDLFDPNGQYVLAYGQMLFTGEYGSSSAMRQFEITLQYNDAARLQRASHLVLCCSASQYGDYFTGSSSSVMYVDDLELVY